LTYAGGTTDSGEASLAFCCECLEDQLAKEEEEAILFRHKEMGWEWVEGGGGTGGGAREAGWWRKKVPFQNRARVDGEVEPEGQPTVSGL
jgi:hypothetical protein